MPYGAAEGLFKKRLRQIKNNCRDRRLPQEHFFASLRALTVRFYLRNAEDSVPYGNNYGIFAIMTSKSPGESFSSPMILIS